MNNSKRRGSALLIVLGFLSFMIVSAVAFAVFMRAERAPSSALRRSVATRHLVHAAMARAISAVDDAIGGDSFPRSVSAINKSDVDREITNYRSQNPYRDNRGNPINIWQGRVFMPPDPDGGTDPGDCTTRFAPISETVSVLNLEGLGYLPPGLVNDVRFLSRCSWSSKWQNFPYDSGRYAYVAVNVSDYFDINKLTADTGRNSSDSGRISLSSVFKRSDGKGVDSDAASSFDQFVHDQRVSDSEGASSSMPYVSMLDYALALGSKYSTMGFGSLGYRSPFYNWITHANSQSLFYETNNTNDNEAVAAKRQCFVTDSWFPASRVSGSSGSDTNLFYEEGQPFTEDAIQKGADANLLEVFLKTGSSQAFWNRMMNDRHYLYVPDVFTLYDYLDRDDVPLSLALPSTERIPMLTAFQPNLNYTLKGRVEKSVTTDPANPAEGQPYTQITTYEVRFQAAHFPGSMQISSVFAFPFKRNKDLNNGSFKAQAIARLFLVATPADGGQITLRGENVLKNMRPTESEWNGSCKAFEMNRNTSKGAVVTYYSPTKTLSYPSSVTEEEDAFMDNGNTMFSLSAINMQDAVFVQRVEKQSMSASGSPLGAAEVSWSFPDEVRPFMASGALLPDQNSDEYATWTLRPYLATWIKVENDEGVVDYVPAVIDDDRELNQKNNQTLVQKFSASEINHGPDSDNGGQDVPAPLLPFTTTGNPVSMSLIIASASAGGADFTDPAGAVNWSPRSYMTVDPRFNWAPEDWLPRSQAATKDTWLDLLDGILGNDERDNDIFMGYSNQGYMQSMGELSMLPRLCNDSGNSISAGFDSAIRTVDCDWTTIAHKDVVWRTYPIDYEVNDENRKLFKMGIVADGNGFRINPYSDDPLIIQSAIECTPVDWWAAGTNTETRGNGANSQSASLKKQILKDAKKALDFAYCEDNTEAQLDTEDAAWIASYITEQFKANANQNWETVFDSLAWYDNDPGIIFGRQLKNNVSIHDVDRKFLYSFWRGCFANKQQLYLLFVRAELNALGGPGEGTPSQQGGRAVALVWRDPNATSNEDNYDGQDTYEGRVERHPHRTRVLFYHQFD